MRENLRNNHWKYHQPCDFGVPFWSHFHGCLRLLRVTFATSFSEPSRGTPKGDFGRQSGAKGCQKKPKWRPKGAKNNAKRTPNTCHCEDLLKQQNHVFLPFSFESSFLPFFLLPFFFSSPILRKHINTHTKPHKKIKQPFTKAHSQSIRAQPFLLF